MKIFALAETNPAMASGQFYGYAYSQTPSQWERNMGITSGESAMYTDISKNVTMMILPWGRLLKGVKWSYSALKARQAARALRLAKFAKLTNTEIKIVEEANALLNQNNLEFCQGLINLEHRLRSPLEVELFFMSPV